MIELREQTVNIGGSMTAAVNKQEHDQCLNEKLVIKDTYVFDMKSVTSSGGT